MARHAYKVKRGMVFWYCPPESSNKKTSVQQGNRPYVVLSCDEGNLTAPTCNVAPCTTEDKTPIPVHIDCWFNGQKNTILLEQMLTIDQHAVGDFICMLTDEVLERVENALTIQYSIRPQVKYADFRLDNIVNKLESIIEEIIKNKVQQYQSVVPQYDIEESALKLGQLIEDLVGVGKVKKPVEIVAPTNITPVSVEEAKSSVSDKPKEEVKKTSAPPVKPAKNLSQGRIKWTEEKRRQYLDDCDKLSPEEVRIKYGFTSIGTVFSTKYNCKNALGLND